MKMRYIVIAFTLCMSCILLYSEINIEENDKRVIDMTKLNDINMEIQEDIKEKDITYIEDKYNCTILPINDLNYNSILDKAIAEGCIVLDYYENNQITGKIILKGLSNNYETLVKNFKWKIRIITISMLVIGYILIYFLYIKLVKPFKNLENFASNIAIGNLDTPLTISKDNYFGAFTESFDIMREELKTARESEYKANISKKELVASISHDIKTPVATIEAICELLLVKVKDIDTINKINIINSKAEVIDELISNMFHATLEELQCLNVELTEEPSTIITEIFNNINHFGKIHFYNNIPECLVLIDKLRLTQVIDNIVNNSYKYANTDIKIKYVECNDIISIAIKDNGNGVSDDDLPLVTEKYYRGKNTKGKSGSGLGLFVSKMFMNEMNGDLLCYNDNGFKVVLSIKKV